MNDNLYHQAITELAKAATGAGHLPRVDARATLDNPLCGDRVTIELALEGDRIAQLAHDVRGCLLCRASASALGRQAPGRSRADMAAVHEALRGMLRNQTGTIAGWPELGAFQPVAPHKSRHDCVLLPIAAVMKALETTGAA